jgi:hypothetical protein
MLIANHPVRLAHWAAVLLLLLLLAAPPAQALPPVRARGVLLWQVRFVR